MNQLAIYKHGRGFELGTIPRTNPASGQEKSKMLFLQRSKKGVYAHLGFFKVFIIKSWRSVPVESVYSKEPSARIQPKIKQKQ